MVRGDDTEGRRSAPTEAQFAAYRAMFEHFNRTLFAGALPEPLLNLSRASRKTVAFFAPDRWEAEEGSTTHEISLNPAHLGKGSARETAQSFVHEMVHLWQQVLGTPSRRGYHNVEWSKKMLEIGLEPLNAHTGQPAMSGHGMSDRIIEGGRFARAFETLPPTALLPWSAVEARARASEPEPGAEGDEGEETDSPSEPTPSRNKVKYTCPACKANVWGRPGLVLVCLGGKVKHEPALFAAASAEETTR